MLSKPIIPSARYRPAERRLTECLEMPFEIEVMAQVGLRTINVRKTILASEGPSAVQAPGFLEHPRIRRKRRNGAADKARRLRVQKIRVLLCTFAPVCLCDAEVVEYGLGAHVSRCDGHRGHTMFV